MPHPLSDALLESLRDPTTAQAAAFVIARWHPEHIAFAAKTMAGGSSLREETPPRRRRTKANGKHLKDEVRLSKRDQDDERLLDAMRRNTEATNRRTDDGGRQVEKLYCDRAASTPRRGIGGIRRGQVEID
jgi:hypothetical protein